MSPKKYNISRKRQDQLAAESHNRAQHVQENGFFKGQIVPIEICTKKGINIYEKDEHIRLNCMVESLSGLRSVFSREGTVTAGNSSGLNDAGAALVLMERNLAEERGLLPMARLVAYSVTGVDPAIMGMGPVSAVKKLLKKAEISKDDVDIWEINEAFAA